jgi:hypothetical protein
MVVGLSEALSYLSKISQTDPHTFAILSIILIILEGIILGILADFIFSLFGIEAKEEFS